MHENSPLDLGNFFLQPDFFFRPLRMLEVYSGLLTLEALAFLSFADESLTDYCISSCPARKLRHITNSIPLNAM